MLHVKGLKVKMTEGIVTFKGIKGLFPYILCTAHCIIYSCSHRFPPHILYFRRFVHLHEPEVKTGERRAWKNKSTCNITKSGRKISSVTRVCRKVVLSVRLHTGTFSSYLLKWIQVCLMFISSRKIPCSVHIGTSESPSTY